jgi:glycosyltransferase involved in cell wall biosynthesis
MLSVIIPCRNGARWLEACVESVAALDDLACEIVVVDDGSTDASVAVARSAAVRIGCDLRIVAGLGRGPAAARNLGQAHATRDICLFLDADDMTAAPGVKALVAPLWQGTADIAIGAWVDVDEQNITQFATTMVSDLTALDAVAGLLDRPRVVSAFAARRPWPEWDESMKVWEVSRWQHRVALLHPRCAVVNSVVTRIRQHRTESRVSLTHPHFDPAVTGRFFVEEKDWLRRESALTPLREEIIDRWLVACAYGCTRVGRLHEATQILAAVNRAALPRYRWFRATEPASFAWLAGIVGLRAHARLSTLFRVPADPDSI